jgi:FdhD protein
MQEIRPLVTESKVLLFTGDKLIHSFYCTPEALRELTIGHLFCNDLIQGPAGLLNYEADMDDPEGIIIRINIDTENTKPLPAMKEITIPGLEKLQALMNNFFDSAEKYKTHGGIHCSALFDGTAFVAQFEDVGRHNAFDKVIGKALIAGLNPANMIYFTSGRVNSEIAEKAGRCGFPLIVSRSIATTRACETARKQGVGIIGRISSSQPLLFTKGRAYA